MIISAWQTWHISLKDRERTNYIIQKLMRLRSTIDFL